jgi:hypothetical protein
MTYRDILARSERRRPDGTPVWPLRDADRPTLYVPKVPASPTNSVSEVTI